MKPNFALKLSHDSVDILQRAPAGWIVIGAARFDAADLDATLARLRAEAEKRDPDGIRSKLIMPASEVRFATVLAPGPTDEARRHQVEAEIEGLTPYALNELAYDFVIEGDHALVALCAREILSEAEHFAQTHGFNPVSFVAIPQAGSFIGEPFFGETAGARAFLAPGTRVQRESEPVRVAGQPAPAAPRPAATPPKASSTPAAERPSQNIAATAGKSVGGLGAAATSVGAPVGAAARAAATVTAAAPEAFSRVGNLVRRMGTRIRREQAQAEPPLPSRTATAPATSPITAPTAPAVGTDAARPTDASRSLDRETPRDRSVPGNTPPDAPATRWRSDTSPTPPAGSKSATPPAAAKWTPDRATPSRPATASAQPARANTASSVPQPAGVSAPQTALARSSATAPPDADAKTDAAPVAFASRRSQTPAASGPALAASGPGAARDKAGPGGRLAVLPNGAEAAGPGRLTRLYRRSRRAAKGALTKIGLFSALEGKGAQGREGAGRGTRRRDGNKADTLQPIVPASRPPVNEKEKATEAESLTIFGARNMQRPEPGFARRGLMLTGGLLLLLVAVAVWAVYFSTSPTRDADVALLPQEGTAALPGIVPPARITEPQAAPPAQTPVASPDPEPVTPAPAPQETPLTPLTPDIPDATAITGEIAPTDLETAEATTDTQAPVIDPEALLEELVQEALNEALPLEMLGRASEEAAEAVAVPPQAETATPPAETAFAGADTPQIAPDGESAPAQQLGLPQQLELPQVSEVAPVSPPPPPPFGTEFTLGADGLVEATPEGALTPAGVMVFSGRPSAEVPPVRPAALAPIAPAPATTEPQASPESTAVPSDAEPGTVAGEAIMDDTPRADPALADARPQPRSARVAAMAAEQAAEPQTDPGTAPAPVDPNDDSSALAPPPGGVSLDTLRPQRRPTDLVSPTDTATETTEITAAEQIAAEAVASSLRPSARPGDLSARIQEALAAVRTPPPAAAAAPVQTAAAAAPNIPSSASVAQQATQTRAINLRRVNLIGVFGTPNDRRALVRLSNGQVIRVQVGDTLDGGRVSAIGDDELRYVKNGRNEVLRIGSSG